MEPKAASSRGCVFVERLERGLERGVRASIPPSPSVVIPFLSPSVLPSQQPPDDAVFLLINIILDLAHAKPRS